MPKIFKHTYVSSPLILKSLQEEGRFCGYASVFNTVDTQGDRVLKGAFQKSLQKKSPPKMLWQHDTKEPIGLWHTLKEDSNGLYVEGQLLLDLQKGREAYSLLKKGILDGLSIGCTIKNAEFSDHDGARELSEVDLLEISLVTFAANTDAKILEVKENSLIKSSPNLIKSSSNALSPREYADLTREIQRAISILKNDKI